MAEFSAQTPLRTLWKQVLSAKLKDFFMPRMPVAFGSYFMGASGRDVVYAAEVGSGLASSVVTPVIHWMQRAFPEAPLVVRTRQDDEMELVDGHPLAQLIERPNPGYPGTLLWMITILDWCTFGESYWRVMADRGGRPAELWWLPGWTVDPKGSKTEFISHYRYQPDEGTSLDLDVEEVLHFRHGLDPQSPRHGLPPLRALMREIWSDQECSTFVASLLRNMGIPGLIITPKGEASLSASEVERVKEYIKGRFTGDMRGEPLALGGPTDVHRLAWSPQELDMSVVRNLVEERVSAALGIPAAVIGFGTGLSNSKVGATMHEFVRMAWSNGIVPMQRLMAAELQRNLLPRFEEDPSAFKVGWDYDEVQALEPDQNELAKRYEGLVLAGLLKVSEGRQALGYETDPADAIYLRPNTHTATDPEDQMPEPLPSPSVTGDEPARAPTNGNGNGNGSNGSRNGSRNGAVATRAWMKQGSLDEWLTDYLGRTARRLEHPPTSVLKLATRLWREQTAVQKRFEPMIRQVFQRYAETAATAARELLQPRKASVENVIRTAILHERLPLAQVRFELEATYRELYAAMFDLLSKALSDMGQPDVTDPAAVQRNLNMAAGQQAILLDLSAEARSAILDTLEKATAAGLSEDDMVAAIKDAVPRGRWSTIEMRAEIIARTESRYALNMASASVARTQGQRMLILDARLGPTDAVCEMRNGFIVTPAQAEALAASEHPSGTLIALPLQGLTELVS